MRQVIILGHETSGYKAVEKLFNDAGMQRSAPSRREQLAPQEITQILLKSHAPVASMSLDSCSQLIVNPIWQSLALDLIIGNIDSPFWGFSDRDSIRFLDYWKDVSRNVIFVLVYDTPEKLLVSDPGGIPEITTKSLRAVVDGWCEYHREIYRFYSENRSRCLLIHAEQARVAGLGCVPLLVERVPALHGPSELTAEEKPWPEEQMAEPVAGWADKKNPRFCDAQSTAVADVTQPSYDDPGSAAFTFLARTLLTDFPEVGRIYSTLQESANLPYSLPKQPTSIEAWRSLTDFRSLVDRLRSESEQSVTLGAARLSEMDLQLRIALDRCTELQDENTLLLAELNKNRADLVKSEGERARLSREVDRLGAIEQVAAKRLETVEHLTLELEIQRNRAERDQGAGVSSRTTASVSFDLGQENALLLAQLHRTKAQLSQTSARGVAKREGDPVSKRKSNLFGAADRVKRQLSYRLGATMIDHSRSIGGWATLPWALVKEARGFRRDQKLFLLKKPPPISQYADHQEARRVKEHLSYRLGAAFLQHIKSPIGWLVLPFALKREVRRFRERTGRGR